MTAISALRAATSRQQRDPSRIGQIRPSHLMTSAGVGAVVDLPALSVIVRGLDSWPPEHQVAVPEPRLLDEVRRVLGPQVRSLRSAPYDPDADPWSRIGVPVQPFPGWVRCPACFRLGLLDGDAFKVHHRWASRPDLAKVVHAQGCGRQQTRREGNRRACIPARFVVACEEGHLDDFPYDEYVHRGGAVTCDGPQLTLQDAASTLTPQVTIGCAQCGASRSIAEATGTRGRAALPVCRGRHPHLQRFSTCGVELRLMVVGASNLWFSMTASALHLPSDRLVGDEVAAQWTILGTQADKNLVGILIDNMDVLRPLRGSSLDEVWHHIEQLRARGGPSDGDDQPTPGDLKSAEWDLLSHPTTEREDGDFRARPTERPAGYEPLLHQVVLVSRLREVRAMLGFTRIQAPEGAEPRARVPLSRDAEQWVPAVEQRGEGVFLELNEDAVSEWEGQVADNERVRALEAAYRRWAAGRDAGPVPPIPTARYILLHTLSHLLIRQMALECGYSSASISERIYVGRPGAPAAGVLLSTAASDSEGTLGGLVALGRAKTLKRLLDGALDEAQRCSSDPLCADHLPADPSQALHAAACHACLFASETTCESNNRWLDRKALVDLGDGFAFLT